VICRQLGFSRASSFTVCSRYGQVPTSFSYDDVACVGTELTLDSCRHLNTHNCGPHEGAGVVCVNGMQILQILKVTVLFF